MEIRPSGAPPAAQPASAGPPHSTTRTPGAATFRPFIALEPLHILKHASPASPSPSSDPALNPWQRPLLVPRLRVPLAPTHLTSGSGPNSLKLDPYLSARSLVASLDPAQRRVVHELGRVLDGETDPKAGIVAHEVRAEIVRLLAEESRDVLPIVFGESPEETEVAEGGVEQSGEVLEGARKARRAKPRWAFENARVCCRRRIVFLHPPSNFLLKWRCRVLFFSSSSASLLQWCRCVLFLSPPFSSSL
ncbi:hypothetical protein M427DRAFT_131531 [Gonapodya prolifera JEL478]|uniref:Uncharacterized protein n=1 Tax=Gonapodya prolifera (strain JEL478) TaxID=1344416 RepID=A0A139ATS7_GONPJ|nr:hypothetical protein M427DRAFT_131531 [Gonapodya prolifera JEL478]|eukprot:KXS20131.1 hypothetical protein M427DRAFT_131531 [Gonapodya prolifera JEL478]